MVTVKYEVMNTMDYEIEVISISGSNPGSKLFIPRIILINSSGTLPLPMK